MTKSPFTPGFFHFLLGFSAIILLSFGLLIYLSEANSQDDTAMQPASTKNPSSDQ